MVSLFKEKSSASVFRVLLVSILLRAHFIIQPPVIVTSPDDGLIYPILSSLPSTLPPVAMSVIYQLIVLLQALRLNYILNDLRMFQKNAFTTALAYLLLTALLPQWNNISSALVANSMLIWLIYRIAVMYNTPHPKPAVYNTGLIAGISLLLYYPAAPLLLLALFALAILRPFRINEWLVLLLGILTPVYFFLGYRFLTDKLTESFQVIKIFEPHIIRPANIIDVAVTCSAAALVIFAGVYQWQANGGRMVIQIRRYWTVLFLMFLFLIPSIFLLRNAWPYALLMAAIPASAFVSNAFLYPKRNTVPAIFFWLLAAIVIYNNWKTIYNQ